MLGDFPSIPGTRSSSSSGQSLEPITPRFGCSQVASQPGCLPVAPRLAEGMLGHTGPIAMVSPLHSASMPPLHSSSSSLDGGAGGNMDPSSLHSALSVASAMGGVSHGFSTPFSTSRLTQQVNQSIAEKHK